MGGRFITRDSKESLWGETDSEDTLIVLITANLEKDIPMSGTASSGKLSSALHFLLASPVPLTNELQGDLDSS